MAKEATRGGLYPSGGSWPLRGEAASEGFWERRVRGGREALLQSDSPTSGGSGHSVSSRWGTVACGLALAALWGWVALPSFPLSPPRLELKRQGNDAHSAGRSRVGRPKLLGSPSPPPPSFCTLPGGLHCFPPLAAPKVAVNHSICIIWELVRCAVSAPPLFS